MQCERFLHVGRARLIRYLRNRLLVTIQNDPVKCGEGVRQSCHNIGLRQLKAKYVLVQKSRNRIIRVIRLIVFELIVSDLHLYSYDFSQRDKKCF